MNSLETLPISLVNNFGGGSINAYVTGLDSSNRLVILQPSGIYYYPTADASISTPQAINAEIAIPLGSQGSTTNITLPGYISSARVWLAEGEHDGLICSICRRRRTRKLLRSEHKSSTRKSTCTMTCTQMTRCSYRVTKIGMPTGRTILCEHSAFPSSNSNAHVLAAGCRAGSA